jgi:hypothetical protein
MQAILNNVRDKTFTPISHTDMELLWTLPIPLARKKAQSGTNRNAGGTSSSVNCYSLTAGMPGMMLAISPILPPLFPATPRHMQLYWAICLMRKLNLSQYTTCPGFSHNSGEYPNPDLCAKLKACSFWVHHLPWEPSDLCLAQHVCSVPGAGTVNHTSPFGRAQPQEERNSCKPA